MSIFAIADLHLSFSENVRKPMDVFGGEWVNHTEKLKRNWEETVSEKDTVIVAGDISWALKPDDATADLNWIRGLPGRKIFIKGNHDLWWPSTRKLNQLYDEDARFLQNNFFEADGAAICGSRGWICPWDDGFTEHDEKIYKREILRLSVSLESARSAGFTEIIGATHFPPAGDKQRTSGFTELFEAYGVKKVFYGHLHGEEWFKTGIRGTVNGVTYQLVSLDYLKCVPFRIEEG